MDIERGIPDHSLSGGRFSVCKHCGTRLRYETPKRCRCPSCDNAYTPGHSATEYDLLLVVTIQR